ncbi:MAG: hypothetical protein ACN4GW_21430 [Desulforhopalus sp.]
MHTDNGEATIEEAISKCFNEGTPECLQELSELIREQEHLLENKYLLYKMVIKHLITGDTSGALRS